MYIWFTLMLEFSNMICCGWVLYFTGIWEPCDTISTFG